MPGGEDVSEVDWFEAENKVMEWAKEVIAVRYRELGLTTDEPVIDLTEQFCGKPDCPPHEAKTPTWTRHLDPGLEPEPSSLGQDLCDAS